MPEKEEKIDLDYCLILIDKVSNPNLSEQEVSYLLKDLADCARHEELQALVQDMGTEADMARLKEEFRNKALVLNGEAPGEQEEPPADTTDYVALLKKMLDPNISDQEYKPTMQQLLGGTLNEDQRHQVTIILNCKDVKDRDLMIHDFEKSFVKKKKKKDKDKAKEKEKAKEADNNIDYLTGDFRTLLDRLIAPNKELSREKKGQIYYRLMEPDVEADFKNAAIKLVNMTDNEARKKLLVEFDAMKERQRVAEALKRAADEKARAEAEEKRQKDRDLKKRLREEREKMEEKMKKRELMLKMRAEQRRRDMEGSRVQSQAERDEERRREMERVKEEMRRFREKQKESAKVAASGKGRPDFATDSGYLLYPYIEAEVSLVKKPRVVLLDLGRNSNSLTAEERSSFDKLLQQLGGGAAAAGDGTKAEGGEKKEDAPAPPPPPQLSPEDSAELERCWTALSHPDISEADETDLFKGLISQQRVDLIKVLVGRVAPVRGLGRSRLFGALCQRYVGERKYNEEKEEEKQEGKEVKEPEEKKEPAAVSERRDSQEASDAAKSLPPPRRESQESIGSTSSKSRHNSGGGGDRSRSRHGSGGEKARSRHNTGDKEQRSDKDNKNKVKSRHTTGEGNKEAQKESKKLRQSTDEAPPPTDKEKLAKSEGSSDIAVNKIVVPVAERRSSESDKENREAGAAESAKVGPSKITAESKRPSTADSTELGASKKIRLEHESVEEAAEKKSSGGPEPSSVMMNPELSVPEARQRLGLKRLDACVRLKNFRKVYRAQMARLNRRLVSTETNGVAAAREPVSTAAGGLAVVSNPLFDDNLKTSSTDNVVGDKTATSSMSDKIENASSRSRSPSRRSSLSRDASRSPSVSRSRSPLSLTSRSSSRSRSLSTSR